MELVKVWREYAAEQGPRGGMRKTFRAQWLGPGCVVFHEVLQGQRPEDQRRHRVWVVIGGTMRRCSVHSARKVTERERLEFEIHEPEHPETWQSLKDLLPKRAYVDVTAEEPTENDEDAPNLPFQPDKSTISFKPKIRHYGKSGPYVGELDGQPASSQQPVQVLPPVPEDDDLNVRKTRQWVLSWFSTAWRCGNWWWCRCQRWRFRQWTLEERATGQPSASRLLEESSKRASSAGDEADSKRPKLEEAETLLFNCLDVCEAAYVLTVELDLNSNREKKKLLHHPSLFLAQKLRDCEVRYEKLRREHRVVFDRAKTKEVNSFLANQAVRRCLNSNEEIEAKQSGRLMRCRWVLTWKPTPVESLEEAQRELAENPTSTTLTQDAKKRAKARIVLLGLEHPDLLTGEHQTASPVQAVITRNVSYQFIMEQGWDVEGIDMSTAFLQTFPTEETKRLWTSGVRELREALQVPEGGVLRILKDFYGSTAAPKNLFQNVDSSLKSLGAVKIKGDACFWLWVEKEKNPES